jgi:heme oxygenase
LRYAVSVNPSPVLTALRAATAPQHASLEAALPLAKADAGAAEYLAYARAMYGWMAPLEDRLWTTCPAPLTPSLRRGKAEWLREDLLAMGLAPAEVDTLPRCHALPPIDDLASRVGAAYVVEGSQLGGQVLLRKLTPALNPIVPRYLVGYGAETGTRWKSLLAAMAALVRSDEEIARAAQIASGTFASLAAWFASPGAA